MKRFLSVGFLLSGLAVFHQEALAGEVPEPGFTTRQQETNPRLEQLRSERRARFARSRQMLLEKGVPFEPNDLLQSDWRERIEPHLATLPEMSRDRFPNRIMKGVYIADRIFLPERVAATGDIVIITRHLVHLGEHIEIDAPGHDVSVFVTGRTSHAAQAKRYKQHPKGKQSPHTVRINTGSTRPAPPRPAPPTQRQRPDRRRASADQPLFLFASAESMAFFVQDQVIEDGMNGFNGGNGQDAPPAGSGEDGSNGQNGTCWGDRDGYGGGNGTPGLYGSAGGNGGNGTGGGSGGNINYEIPEDGSGTYWFSARGGHGGSGGNGGSGADGGRGGHGGRGGNAATCADDCAQGVTAGKGGPGGNGGNAGSGGNGARGGDGGNGGNGGSISVSNRSCWGYGYGDAGPGQAGYAGYAGYAGVGGSGGVGGLGGAGSEYVCANTETGRVGQNGNGGSGGTPGDHGNGGSHGNWGSVNIEGPRMCAPEDGDGGGGDPGCNVTCDEGGWLDESTCSCYYPEPEPEPDPEGAHVPRSRPGLRFAAPDEGDPLALPRSPHKLLLLVASENK